MARDQAEISVGGSWVELTNADASLVVFQVLSGAVFVRATTGAASPLASAKGLLFRQGGGVLDLAIADLFPGAANARLWARSSSPEDASVLVSHG